MEYPILIYEETVFENILLGLYTISDLTMIITIVMGVFMGILVGSLPGLTSTMGVTLLLPFTFAMEPIPGISALVALYCGSQYGGSIPGILLNTPGTSEAAISTIDGYQLTKKGKAGKALGLSVIASAIGGFIGVGVLLFFAPAVAKLATTFAPPEYFCLALFGMSMVINLEAGSELKNILGGLVGLLLTTVGYDALSGQERFTFGSVNLSSGINFIPVMIGVFAAAEVFRQAESYVAKKLRLSANLTKLPRVLEIWRLKWCMLRSITIGILVGALPAAGSTMATFLAYNEAKRWSKKPDDFGKGSLEGIVAPESANNAGAAGAMLPTLTVGIPGSGVTAVILGGLMIHGIRPGPLLFVNQQEFVYAIFMSMALANLLMLLMGVFGVRFFANILRVPGHMLNPLIMVLCVVGSFALQNNLADVWVMLIAGISGFYLNKAGFSPLPIIIGMVLGQIMEVSFRQTMVIFENDLTIFISRPYAACIIFVTLLSALWPVIAKRYRSTITEFRK